MKHNYFEEIAQYILENEDKFYRLAYSNVQNPQDAMDVVQNAIYKALSHAGELKDIHAVKTWFYRILMNESINFLKKNRRELLVEELVDEDAYICMQEYDEAEELDVRLRKLPTEVQNIIRLRFYEELSLQEIAEVTGRNLNTIKAKLYRGLKALRVEMEGLEL
ncbi:MAG: RNA polymerase sigma factor [Lachnospiraceae bacterium]|nr:RNA polymerase sigma factor [Lachnospiraceae bacterium]